MTCCYKKYPQMTSSAEVIIEDYPAHWVLTRVKFNSIVKARVGWHGLKSDDFTDEGPFLVTGSDFQGKFIRWEQCYHCDEERYAQDSNIQLKNGDLLITKDGTIGKVALVSGLEGKATLNSGVFVVRPIHQEYTTQYYYWLLLSRSFIDFVDYYKTGSTIAHLYQDTFVNFKFPLPPLNEQQKIANFLDHETAKIDTLIAKQEKLIELLKEKRQAVISHAVTKGISYKGQPDAPMKDSGVEWLGEVPEHWVVMRLKHLIKFLESGCSVNAADIPAKEDEIGVLKTSCVYTRRFRAGENKTVVMEDLFRVKCPVRKGAIIISRMNTPELVGASALVDTEASNLFLPDRLWQTIFNDQFEVNPEFLAHFMTVEGFRNQISLSAEGASSSMQNIAKEDYLAINALLPQLKEQAEIVSYIKENEAKFLRLEAQAVNAIELMKERKTALISAAVTGKIDVRDWEENN